MIQHWTQSYPKEVSAEAPKVPYENLAQLLEDVVKKYPRHTAFSNMGKKMTYRQLEKKAKALSVYFKKDMGLKPGDSLAIQVPNLLQYPVCIFAAFLADLKVTSLNPLYTQREIKHQLNDSEASAIVTVDLFASKLEEVLPETGVKQVLITSLGDMQSLPKRVFMNFALKHIKKMVPDYNIPHAHRFLKALKKHSCSEWEGCSLKQEDLAVIQYTGGTTGVSKGAMLTHRNILTNVFQVEQFLGYNLERGSEVFVSPLPLYHIFAFTVSLYALIGGHESFLITNPKDIPGFKKELEKKGRWTIMLGVNTLFQALLNYDKFKELDFSSLKFAIAGGAALQLDSRQRWEKLTDSLLIEGYGLTEASPVVAINPLVKDRPNGSIGLALPGTQVRLVDDKGEDVLEPGERGELCVKGPQVMQGYWKRDEETGETLKNGWLYTGDIATFDEKGFLYIVDRKKDMILVSGFNVYPNEVEDVLASHPKVLEVAVVGKKSSSSGEIVKAYIVKACDTLTKEEIISYAKKSLTAYKVPREVEFRSELPKSNVGKILRRKLKEA